MTLDYPSAMHHNEASSSRSPYMSHAPIERSPVEGNSGKRKRSRSPSPRAGPGHTRPVDGSFSHRSPDRAQRRARSPPRGEYRSNGKQDDGDDEDDMDSWTYRLAIIQQPQRARACGFGDKDRRPLSPPPIIQLLIYTRRGRLVNPDFVSYQFLVLMVDLWSGDQANKRNVVVHPSSSQAKDPSPRASHFSVPEPLASSSRVVPSEYSQGPYSRPEVPEHPPYFSPGPSPHTRLSGGPSHSPQVPNPLPLPRSPPGRRFSMQSDRPALPRAQSYSNHNNPSRLSLEPPTDSGRPFSAPSRELSPLLRTHHVSSPLRPTLTLPPLSSITSLYRPSSSSSSSYPLTPVHSLEAYAHPPSQSSSTRPTSSDHAFHTGSARPSWSSDARSSQTDYSFGHGSTSSFSAISSAPPGSREGPAQRTVSAVSDRWYDPVGTNISASTYTSFLDNCKRTIPQATGNGHTQRTSPPSANPQPKTEPSRAPYTPAGDSSYSRVLVGSLCTVCQKLQGQDGRTGLFFFAHDLGVRTEGTFTLRFALANLTSLMQGTGKETPVLAEAFSEPFQVYSAKRFPGVVPTTDLTRVFARQNVRLPTRQRRTEAAADADSGGEDN